MPHFMNCIEAKDIEAKDRTEAFQITTKAQLVSG